MMDTIVIRQIQRADYEGWLPLWRAYNEFYETDVSDEVTTVTWNRMLDPESFIGGLVAQSSSRELVGFAAYVVHRSTWSVRNVCYLEDLFVAETQRNRGVGEMLIKQLIDHARGKFWENIYWMTKADNKPARALYDSIAGDADGFVRYRIPFEDKMP